jgi:hypothetical protein
MCVLTKNLQRKFQNFCAKFVQKSLRKFIQNIKKKFEKSYKKNFTKLFGNFWKFLEVRFLIMPSIYFPFLPFGNFWKWVYLTIIYKLKTYKFVDFSKEILCVC